MENLEARCALCGNSPQECTCNVISRYTDRDAVEDGTLVELNARDRVTRTCFEWLAKNAPETSKPPANWPVDMLGWFRAGVIEPGEAAKTIAKYGLEAQQKYERQVRDRKALALSKGLISVHGSRARRVYEQNLDGGILTLYAVTDHAAKIEALSEKPVEHFQQRLWLVPSDETSGITLMFPEDY